MSIKDVARKLKLSVGTILHFVQKDILPQPIKLQIGYRELRWNTDELELYIFKNAKQAIDTAST
jgi:predicted DNA-binding transcriptional regulator AlpA